MSSIGVLIKGARPRAAFRAPILGVACAIALACAVGRADICAADVSGAAPASAVSSPAASASPVVPIAAATAPAAATTPAAAPSAVADVSSYVADSTAPPRLASPVSSPVADLGDSGADAPDPAETPIATIPPNLLKTPPDPYAVPSTTVEIAPAIAEPAASSSPALIEEDSSSFVDNPEVVDYEKHQEDAALPGPPGGTFGPPSMQMSALSEDAISSPIGLELREARRTLKSGEEADGLLITEVTKGSPAAIAGLHAYAHGMHTALTAAAVVASLFVAPAVIAIPIIDYTQVGESYDMIIGVDGVRVTDFLDFQDRMRDLKPGEIVYLSVVRDGRRHQFRVNIPLGTNLASW